MTSERNRMEPATLGALAMFYSNRSMITELMIRDVIVQRDKKGVEDVSQDVTHDIQQEDRMLDEEIVRLAWEGASSIDDVVDEDEIEDDDDGLIGFLY